MEPDKDKLSWYWMLRWLAGSLIVVGNLTVIYVISTRKGLQKTTNWFVFSLACSDLGVGGIIVPASYICTFKIKCELEILHVCYNILLYVSVWNLCVLTVDRYIAVVYSLSYSSIMTHSRMKFLLSFTWELPIITSFIPLTFKLVEGNNRSGNTEKIFRVVVLFAFEILPCLDDSVVYPYSDNLQKTLACNTTPRSSTGAQLSWQLASRFARTDKGEVGVLGRFSSCVSLHLVLDNLCLQGYVR